MTATAPVPGTVTATPAGEWQRISEALSAETPDIAGRAIPVRCVPGAGGGSPARYIYADPPNGMPEPLIEVDGRLLRGVPSSFDPSRLTDRLRQGGLWGAFTHEGAHVRFTSEALPMPGRANWCQAATLLEESRIEARQVSVRPPDRRWLRASASEIILSNFTAIGAGAGTSLEAGNAAALLLAREDAGIFKPGETAAVKVQVESAIGTESLSRLRSAWQAAHRTADGDIRAMARLGRRWCRILGIDPDAVPPEPDPPAPGNSAILDSILDAAAAIAAAVEAEVQADLAAAGESPGTGSRPGGGRQKGETRGSGADTGDGIFDPDAAPPRTTKRSPRPDEIAAARRLAASLRNATVGGRTSVEVTSQTPPGRLSMRNVVSARAQEAAGAVPDARPFTRTVRRRVPAPPLVVGIGCDTSGSISQFTRPVASAAWILNRAVGHLPAATAATVLFGSRVHALTRPGEVPAHVTDFLADGAYEEFCGAVDALDEKMGLSRPGKARLLVVVSDMRFKRGQVPGGQRRITRLARSGCGILVLRPAAARKPDHNWTDCRITDIGDPASTIGIISQAAVRAIREPGTPEI